MGMSEKSYAGGCFCGAVSYEVSGTPRFLCYCHCESCRHAAGSPAVAWGTFERSGFRVTRGRMREFNSSPKVTRGFCADCGSCLTYSHEGRPGDIDVTLATLEEAADHTPLGPSDHGKMPERNGAVHQRQHSLGFLSDHCNGCREPGSSRTRIVSPASEHDSAVTKSVDAFGSYSACCASR